MLVLINRANFHVSFKRTKNSIFITLLLKEGLKLAMCGFTVLAADGCRSSAMDNCPSLACCFFVAGFSTKVIKETEQISESQLGRKHVLYVTSFFGKVTLKQKTKLKNKMTKKGSSCFHFFNFPQQPNTSHLRITENPQIPSIVEKKKKKKPYLRRTQKPRYTKSLNETWKQENINT